MPESKKVAKTYSDEIKKTICDYLNVKNVAELEKLSLLDSTLTYDVILDKLNELDKRFICKEN